MKKLALFLALFVTVGAANASCPVQQKAQPCPTQCETPCPVTQCETPAPCASDCMSNAPANKKDCKAYFENKYLDLCKKLCLTKEQRCKADALHDKIKCDMKPLKERMRCAHDKLCSMIQCDACMSDIKAQESEIKELKKEAKAKLKCYNKEFECILTPCQKKQYRSLKRAEVKKMKKFGKYCPCYFYECSK